MAVLGAAAWLAGATVPARAQEGLGVGLSVGEPTGLSLKAWMTPTTAFDWGLAWSFLDGTAVDIHGDYLFHRNDAFYVERGRLPLYYGMGARLKILDHDSVVGIRGPVGLEYLFPDSRFGLFGELVPVLDVLPDTRITLNGSLGARYYFR